MIAVVVNVSLSSKPRGGCSPRRNASGSKRGTPHHSRDGPCKASLQTEEASLALAALALALLRRRCLASLRHVGLLRRLRLLQLLGAFLHLTVGRASNHGHDHVSVVTMDGRAERTSRRRRVRQTTHRRAASRAAWRTSVFSVRFFWITSREAPAIPRARVAFTVLRFFLDASSVCPFLCCTTSKRHPQRQGSATATGRPNAAGRGSQEDAGRGAPDDEPACGTSVSMLGWQASASGGTGGCTSR
eukprot:scaffold3815_cov355-Prasinococcus_capsulatus_cf.AAC.2